VSAFPATRLRRLRRTDALRSLVRETRLDLDDFVMPYFAGPTTVLNEALPGMSRYSVEDLVAEAGELVRLGGKAVLLFGVPEEKDDEGFGRLDRGRDRAACAARSQGRASGARFSSPTSACASTRRTATAA
jgi:porphobilinogen synthase